MRDVMVAGVLPTIAALVVASVMMVERIQTNWLAPSPSNSGLHALVVWFVPVFVFALAHIAGTTYLNEATLTPRALTMRATKAVVFAILHFIPYFGAYIVFVGYAFGFAVGITIVGLLLVPIVAPMASGAIFGGLLAIAVAPSWGQLTRKDYLRLRRYYCIASIFAATIVYWLQGSFDPQSAPSKGGQEALFTTFMAFVAVILSCGLIWRAGLQAYWTTGRVASTAEFKSGIRIIAATAMLLLIVATLMIRSGVTFFGEKPVALATLASAVRGDHPLRSK